MVSSIVQNRRARKNTRTSFFVLFKPLRQITISISPKVTLHSHQNEHEIYMYILNCVSSDDALHAMRIIRINISSSTVRLADQSTIKRWIQGIQIRDMYVYIYIFLDNLKTKMRRAWNQYICLNSISTCQLIKTWKCKQVRRYFRSWCFIYGLLIKTIRQIISVYLFGSDNGNQSRVYITN